MTLHSFDNGRNEWNDCEKNKCYICHKYAGHHLDRNHHKQ